MSLDLCQWLFLLFLSVSVSPNVKCWPVKMLWMIENESGDLFQDKWKKLGFLIHNSLHNFANRCGIPLPDKHQQVQFGLPGRGPNVPRYWSNHCLLWPAESSLRGWIWSVWCWLACWPDSRVSCILMLKSAIIHYRNDCWCLGAEMIDNVSLFVWFYRYPITKPRKGCSGNLQDQPGIRTYGKRKLTDTYDVYCYVDKLDGKVALKWGFSNPPCLLDARTCPLVEVTTPRNLETAKPNDCYCL